MKNADNKSRENVHLFIGLRRNKENPDLQPLCFREIIENEEVDLQRLKDRINSEHGIWRIHKTVNARSTEKAMKLLQHKMIEEPDICQRLMSIWKTCLLQKAAKAERNFMFDVDTKVQEDVNKVRDELTLQGIAYQEYETPNGYHFVTPVFDPRAIESLEFVTLHRDGYRFVEMIKSTLDN